MASPHVPADMFQSGGGDLLPSLFPHLDTTAQAAFLQAKLTEGYARTDAAVPPLTGADRDAAAIAWAYAEAMRSVWLRLSNTPASFEVGGEAKVNYLAVQIQTFKDLYDDYLGRFLSFFPVPAGESSPQLTISTVPTALRY